MHALGVKVTLLVRSVMLRFLDEDLHAILVENMQKLGLDLRLQAPHEAITKNADGSL